jgi:hypothetical protein
VTVHLMCVERNETSIYNTNEWYVLGLHLDTHFYINIHIIEI